MRVFGLPRHVTRGDALKRWRQARGDGLTAKAQAVGVPCATPYLRWAPQDRGRLVPPASGSAPNDRATSVSESFARISAPMLSAIWRRTP